MGRFRYITSKEVIGRLYQALTVFPQNELQSMLSIDSPSDSAKEVYAWLGQVPQLRKWFGPRVAKDLNENTYELINELFETSIRIQKADMRRDKTGGIDRRINQIVTRSSTHWMSLFSTLITANTACYDGQNFFSATHSEVDSGTQDLLTQMGIQAGAVMTICELFDLLTPTQWHECYYLNLFIYIHWIQWDMEFDDPWGQHWGPWLGQSFDVPMDATLEFDITINGCQYNDPTYGGPFV